MLQTLAAPRHGQAKGCRPLQSPDGSSSPRGNTGAAAMPMSTDPRLFGLTTRQAASAPKGEGVPRLPRADALNRRCKEMENACGIKKRFSAAETLVRKLFQSSSYIINPLRKLEIPLYALPLPITRQTSFSPQQRRSDWRASKPQARGPGSEPPSEI